MYETFLNGTYLEREEIATDMAAHPEKKVLEGKLKVELTKQIRALREALSVHARVCPEPMLPLHEHIDKMFKKRLEEFEEMGVDT